MAKDRLLTFEQLQPALHKWARHFQNNRFDHWELINAVWEIGQVQKLNCIKFASARVRYDMIDYLRKQLGRSPKPYTNSLSYYDYSEDATIEESLEDKANRFQQIETNDYFKILLEGFTRREKIAIRLRYELDYEHSEIAKVIGVSNSMVSLIMAQVHKVIKAKMTKQA